MKLLIVLSLFAVACAEVQVVQLPAAAAPAYELPDAPLEDLRVRVVDAPLPAPEIAPVDDAFKVLVVDSPLPEAVKIEAPQQVVEAVRVVDAPLPAAEPVKTAMPVVEPVIIAEPHLPGKQYPDPMWR